MKKGGRKKSSSTCTNAKGQPTSGGFIINDVRTSSTSITDNLTSPRTTSVSGFDHAPSLSNTPNLADLSQGLDEVMRHLKGLGLFFHAIEDLEAQRQELLKADHNIGPEELLKVRQYARDMIDAEFQRPIRRQRNPQEEGEERKRTCVKADRIRKQI